MRKYQIWILVALAVIVVVTTIAVAVLPDIISAYKVRSVEGTITFVDVASRHASLEVRSPKDGHLVEISGVVPEDCPILINGRKGSLAEVVTGDRAAVSGTWNKKTREVRAISVDIRRTSGTPARGAAESASETRPAGAS